MNTMSESQEVVEATPDLEPSRGVSASSGTHTHRAATRKGKGKVLPTIAEYALTLIVALLVAVLIKTFLVQPFFIPSASMRPTLMEDDKILVSKLHPGVLDLHRGDIIVFEDPGNWVGAAAKQNAAQQQTIPALLSHIGLTPDPSQSHLVKRLIGVGGDHIVCPERGAKMIVNGVELNEEYIAPESGACQVAFDVTVPKGKLWVMGDNRFNSADSADHYARGESGFVDESRVTGKAILLYLPFDRWSTLDSGSRAFNDVENAA